MLKLRILLLLLIGFSLSIKAQNQRDYQWFFGIKDYDEIMEGFQSYMFDFRSNPIPAKLSDNGVGIGSQNASICDKEGNLLFFTNGCAVLNRDRNIMPNGDSINAGDFFDVLWKGDCNNGYPGFEDIIILTDPASIDGFYILHKSNIYIAGQGIDSPREILYTFVDMNLDDKKGDVVLKNIPFTQYEPLMSSYLTAIHHKNGHDWWIIQPKRDNGKIYTYLLDSLGFHREEDQNLGFDIDHDYFSAAGTAKFSPDGTKYAIYNYFHQLYIYDFDRATGKLSNPTLVEIYPVGTKTQNFCSVEWSPNSRFVYTASILELHQVDTWEEDMQDGIVLIDTYDGTQNPFSNIFFLMAQGPDCRIYMCSTSGNKTYHVINHPDEKGLDCDFDQNGIELPYNAGFGSMPNHPRWRVDEEEKCDPTISSVFGMPVYTRKDLDVYPNPTRDIVHVKIPENKKGILEVRNNKGILVLEEEVMGQTIEWQLNLGSYSSGLYYIEFVPAENKKKILYTGKVELLR